MIVPMAGFATKPLPRPFSLTSALHNLSIAPKRTFSSTRAPQTTAKLPAYVPPYPYGPNRIFKQANNGLYGGAVKQFGNKISKGRNKGKTRRSWKPNIRQEKLYSAALNKHLQIKVQHRVLRTIKKVGGLDAYLLGDKPARIRELGTFGWGLRWKIMQTPKMKEKFAEERRKLGLPEEPGTFDEYVRQQQEEAMMEEEAAEGEAPRETPALSG
jgi:large subunit ribosomal protein L28